MIKTEELAKIEKIEAGLGAQALPIDLRQLQELFYSLWVRVLFKKK